MKKCDKRLILIFSFLMCISFYTPIFASFLQTLYKLNNSQITLLYACASLSIFLFELPTGVLSDRIGEHWALIIGSALTAISTVLFIIGNVPLLYVGEIIFGIGSTFFSGPFDVLLYQYCEQADEELDYSEFVSRNYSVQWLALCVSFLGCSLLALLGNLVIPFYATLIANCATFFLAFYLPKDKNRVNRKSDSVLLLAFKEICDNKDLRNKSFMNAAFSMLLVSGYQLLQPYLSNSEIEVSYNGLLYCVAALFASWGAFIFNKLHKVINSEKKIIVCAILLVSGCFFCLSKASNVIVVSLTICSYRLIWGVTSPMFSFIINNSIITDECRDTVFSLISLASNLLSSVLLFVLAMAKQTSEANYFILCLVALLLLVGFLREKNNSK